MIAALCAAVFSATLKGGAPPETVVFLAPPVERIVPSKKPGTLRLSIRGGGVAPRVSAAAFGSSVSFESPDAVFFDLSCYVGLSELFFRHKFVAAGDTFRATLSRPGLLTLENENRPIPRAYVYVTPTRCFALSDSSGQYRLAGVPPGRQRITAWNEASGTEDAEIEIPGSGETVFDFKFARKK
jgi:hypothetical protein